MFKFVIVTESCIIVYGRVMYNALLFNKKWNAWMWLHSLNLYKFFRAGIHKPIKQAYLYTDMWSAT